MIFIAVFVVVISIYYYGRASVNRFVSISIIILIVGILVACGPSKVQIAAQTTDAQTSAAEAWTDTPAATATETPLPTATPTATHTPTITPTLEPTPFGGSGKIAFMAQYRGMGGQSALFIYDFETEELTPIYYFAITSFSEWGHEVLRAPVWSPDAQYIAFAHGGFAYVINTEGGNASRLNQVQNQFVGSTITYSPNGQHVLAVAGGDILVANADGSEVRNITAAYDETFAGAIWSPNSNQLLAIRVEGEGDSREYDLYIITPDGTELIPLANDPEIWEFGASWVNDEKILFVSTAPGASDIYYINADGTRLEQITDDPETDIRPALSPDGLHIAFVSTRHEPGCWPDCKYSVYLMDTDGSNVIQVGDTGDQFLEWSPDGTQLAIKNELWDYLTVANADGTDITRLRFGVAAGGWAWSPDSKQILIDGNDAQLHYITIGSNMPVTITSSDEIFPGMASWAPILN